MAEELKVTSNRGRSRAASAKSPESPAKEILASPMEKPPKEESSLPAQNKARVEHELHMGLGDAVLRLIHVESFYANIPDPGDHIVAERKLIVEALNQKFQLNLGMDCDADGIPDTIEDSVSVFAHSAKTSCCRISKDKPAQKEAQEPSGEVTPAPAKGRGFFANLFGSNT